MELKVIFNAQANDKVKLVRTVEVYPVNDEILDEFVHGFVFCDCGNVVAHNEDYPLTCCDWHNTEVADAGIDYVQAFLDCLYSYSVQINQDFTQEWLDTALFEFVYDHEFNELKQRS